MNERIKQIEGWPYYVSESGRVFNKRGRELKPCVNNSGYQLVQLCNKGTLKHFLVHRLVARAFIPNPENLPQVNHKNEDKRDNRVENLEWCTPNYNLEYSGNHIKAARASAMVHRKSVICTTTGTRYSSVREAAETTGARQDSISHCLHGRKPTAGGLKWAYAEK